MDEEGDGNEVVFWDKKLFSLTKQFKLKLSKIFICIIVIPSDNLLTPVLLFFSL